MAARDLDYDETILNNIGVGIAIIDTRTHKIKYVNNEMTQFTLYEPSELLGKAFITLFDEKDQEKVRTFLSLRPVDEGLLLHERELFQIRKKSRRSISVSLSSKFKSKCHECIVTVINNEPRKELESELENAYAQMVETSKFISLAEMAAGIAHEINNPLAIIHGTAEKLSILTERNQLKSDVASEIAEKIRRNTMRASKIIDNLKMLSRNDSGDPHEVVEVNEIITNSIDLCKQKFRRDDIDLQINLTATGRKILCSETQILQVLLNLAENAYYAAKQSEDRWVRISSLVEEEKIKITVEDSGAGIPVEIRSEIMNPFFTTKKMEGTGLGLSLSKTIIGRHSGELRLDTSASNTCFEIILPESKEKTPDQRMLEEFEDLILDSQDLIKEDKREELKTTDWSQFHVLIVDDEVEIVDLVKFHLMEEGFRVTVAYDGAEALEVLEKEKVDLLLSDVRMPRLDGLELLQELKTRNDKTRAIFMTGSVNVAHDELFAKGVEAVFEKPISLREVIAGVQHSLLPVANQWSSRSLRLNFDHNLELNYSLTINPTNQVVNIGRGGMFIKMADPNLVEGEMVGFHLKIIDGGRILKIRGNAIVRWVRRKNEEQKPPGVGVQFNELSPDDSKVLFEILQSLRAEAFIPDH